MTCPSIRTYPRSLSAAFSDERAWCIEGPRGQRMALRIKTRQSLLARIWRWLWRNA